VTAIGKNEPKNVGTYDIDTSEGDWNLPTGVKAVLVRLAAKWSSADNDYCMYVRPKGSSSFIGAVRSESANEYHEATSVCPCDDNGDFQVVIVGANATGVYVEIHGYWT